MCVLTVYLLHCTTASHTIEGATSLSLIPMAPAFTISRIVSEHNFQTAIEIKCNMTTFYSECFMIQISLERRGHSEGQVPPVTRKGAKWPLTDCGWAVGATAVISISTHFLQPMKGPGQMAVKEGKWLSKDSDERAIEMGSHLVTVTDTSTVLSTGLPLAFHNIVLEGHPVMRLERSHSRWDCWEWLEGLVDKTKWLQAPAALQ